MAQGLMLHAGAHSATLDQINAAPTPQGTETWTPIPHGDLVALTKDHLTGAGMEVVEESYGLLREGARMFGVLALKGERSDFQLTVGLRNSHDKAFPASLGVGSRVFVCDNLAFSAEVTVARRHTKYILEDLPKKVGDAVGKLLDERTTVAARFDNYRATPLEDMRDVHDLLLRLAEIDAIPPRLLMTARSEYLKPRHPEFAGRNLYSLFNAVTETLKATSPVELPLRTRRLHELCDMFSRTYAIN